ncbi:MAG: hypothetical protein ACHQSE_07605 [Gemmatimonadales bacterium]
MDVLVMLQEFPDFPDQAPVLAQVNSVPSYIASEHLIRDVVTLYGVPNAESLALALAAALESSRHHVSGEHALDVTRHVGVWPERGAIGDAAWLDSSTGEVVKREVEIPLAVLLETAGQLLAECGQGIRRLLAGLLMPDWPEGTSRAINFSFAPAVAGGRLSGESLLASLREADGPGTDGDES